jgi:transcriptional regulator with XRE-family HTH domain
MYNDPGIDGDEIRSFRRANNLNQQELAGILNVGITTVSRWETGDSRPTGTARAVLATLLTSGPVERLTYLGRGSATAEGLIGSGYALYTLLKRRFEGDDAR